MVWLDFCVPLGLSWGCSGSALSELCLKTTVIVNSSGSLNEHFLSCCDQLPGMHM